MFKALDLWLPAYLRQTRWQTPPGRATHIMLCVCDHFEPFHRADKKEAMARMALWKREWPQLSSQFSDADGIHPRHSFFYPIEQYDADVISELAEICQLSGGETEIHLHHKDSTAERMREQLEQGKADFRKHGLLSRDEKGCVRYGFVHGDWALDNSHPQGRCCGVKNELEVLQQTGCYADFTMPSAPNPSQTRIINSLYYAQGTSQPKSHDTGELCRVSNVERRENGSDARRSTLDSRLLLVQGPLGLNWEQRKFGVLPRIENADLTGANPPRPDRMRLWIRLGIRVQGKDDWLFLKLHTHGAIPRNSGVFLSETMRVFHQHLREEYRDNDRFKLHYVTARELVNILHAAEDGQDGQPGEYRNYRYQLLKR